MGAVRLLSFSDSLKTFSNAFNSLQLFRDEDFPMKSQKRLYGASAASLQLLHLRLGFIRQLQERLGDIWVALGDLGKDLIL